MCIDPTLFALLTKLAEQTNWCPYCFSEYVCDDGCILKPYWFKGISGHSDREAPDYEPDLSS